MAQQQLFYFAWIDEAETFDPAVHNRFDENILGGQIGQHEGDFAFASLEIKNPRVGLLAPGRKVWAFVAYDDGIGNVHPLFKGRLIAIPDNIFDQVVTMQFTARPSDFVEKKRWLANQLRELPYWDPLLIAPDRWDDDDTVLEARSALWHIDPVTHDLTISDVLVPEDGVIDFNTDEHFYDGISLQLGSAPLRTCRVTATYPWINSGSGSIDLSTRLMMMYPDKRDYELIWSYTFDGLSKDWPKPNSKFGNGWVVLEGDLIDVTYSSVKLMPIPAFINPMTVPHALPEGSLVFEQPITHLFDIVTTAASGGLSIENVLADAVMAVPGWGIPRLSLAYAGSRNYAQTIDFTLTADVQSIVTDAGGDDILEINLTSNVATDPGYWGNNEYEVSGRDFVNSPRGLQSVEHLLLLARANMCARARAIEISFEAPWNKCINEGISLRKGALKHNPRLPGGQASGKIKSYVWSFGGDGVFKCGITIGCSIGYGGAITGDVGTPGYIEDDYIDPTHFRRENTIVLLGTNDVTYTMPSPEVFDDGIDFRPGGIWSGNAVKNMSVTNGPNEQAAAIIKIGMDQAGIDAMLKELYTKITVEMKPLNTGPFEIGILPTLSMLQLPKQIDLEAVS
jgi:hypothetical protein